MKNKLIITAFILGLVSFSGCKKYLNLPPKNQLTVTTVEDAKSLLASYLRGVAEPRVKPLYGSIMPISPAVTHNLFEAYSDNIDFETAVPQTYLKPNNQHLRGPAQEPGYADYLLWNQYTIPDFIWSNHYEVIGFLNALIDQMDEITGATSQQRDHLLGEMHVHRAYFFFKLLQYFAPYDKANLGIPVYLHTGKGVLGVDVSRKSHAEVYKAILDDLSAASEMIGRTPAVAGFNVFYSKRYINHILAQVYWFKAESPAKEPTDYEKLKTHALVALENVDPYIPTTHTAMINAYAGKDPNYPAHCMIHNAQGTISMIYGSNFQYLNPGQFGPENIPLTTEFASLFTPNDIRIAAYFNTDPTRAGGKVGTAGKTLAWHWPTDGNPLGNVKPGNACLFKPEEAYLLLAEAQSRLNATADAIATLNKFKTFRNAGTVSGLSGAALLNEIINERRKEFFGDSDKRWIDLKRYANKTITRNLSFFQKPYNLSVPPNDYRYALPIPLAELEQNPNMIPNEGWVRIQY